MSQDLEKTGLTWRKVGLSDSIIVLLEKRNLIMSWPQRTIRPAIIVRRSHHSWRFELMIKIWISTSLNKSSPASRGQPNVTGKLLRVLSTYTIAHISVFVSHVSMYVYP